MSHFKAEMHQLWFPVSVRLFVCPRTIGRVHLFC